jgi:hypothetical protein
MNLISRASSTALSLTLLALALSMNGCAIETASDEDAATADGEVSTTHEALSTETNDGFWIDQNPAYPGVYYKKLGGGCYRGGWSSGTNNCKLVALQTNVSYWLTVDPRWPGVYYHQTNGTCPSGGEVAGANCRVVAFDQSYLNFPVQFENAGCSGSGAQTAGGLKSCVTVSGTVGSATLKINEQLELTRPLHELGNDWHCVHADLGVYNRETCVLVTVLAYDQPNKVVYRMQGRVRDQYLGTWSTAQQQMDATVTNWSSIINLR